MDLPPPPPPPPPPFFPHQSHHNLRYVNLMHPPNFVPPLFPRYHTPPPPTPPPHIFLPPSPPPPSRHSTHHSLPRHFAFSSPHHPIAETNPIYEFDRLPEPYPGHDPFSAPSLRGNLPSRLSYDYSERDPISRDDTYRPGSSENLIDRLRENLHWGAREFSAEVFDVGGNHRYGDMIYCGSKLYNKLDDVDRRCNNGVNLYNERDDAERRWDSDFCNRGRERNVARRDYGMDVWAGEAYHIRDADLRSRGCGVQSRVSELYSERVKEPKRKSNGVSDRSRELYNERDGFGLGRFAGRLGRRICDEDLNRSRKKRRVQKIREFDWSELGQPCGRSSGGNYSQQASKESTSSTFRAKEKAGCKRLVTRIKENKSQQASKESTSCTFRSKEKEGCKRLETRMKENKEREQSLIELDISFKSNALVAKAILPPSSLAVKSDMDLTPTKVNIVHGSPSAQSSKYIGKTEISTGGIDIQSNTQGISEEHVEKPAVSENQSLNSNNVNDFVENATEVVTLKDICGWPMVESTENVVKPENLKRETDIQSNVRGLLEKHLGKSMVSEKSSMITAFSNDLCEIAEENGIVEDVCGSSSPKSGKNLVKTEILILGSDIQSDVYGIPEELLEKCTVSGNVSVTAPDSNYLGTNDVEDETLKDLKLQGSNYMGSGQMRVENKISPQMSNDSVKRNKDNTASSAVLHLDGSTPLSKIDENDAGNAAPSAVLQLNTETNHSKSDELPDAALLPLTGGTISKEAYGTGDSNKSRIPYSKRKRSSLFTLHMHDSRVTKCPIHPERFVTFTEVAARRHQSVINAVADRANETCLPDESILVSLGFSRHAFNINICMCNGASVLDLCKNASELSNQFSSLGTNGAYDTVDQSFHNSAGSSRPQQTKKSEIHVDEFLSEVQESSSAPDAICLSLDKPENIRIPVAGSERVALGEVLPDEVNIPQVGADAVEMTSMDGIAVADCSNSSLGTETNSKFLLVDHKGIDSEVDISFLSTLSKQSCDDVADLLHKSDSVKESDEAINGMNTCLSIDHMDFSVLNNNEQLDTVSSIDGARATLLANDLISAPEVDFPGRRCCFEGVDSFSEGPSTTENLNLDVDFGEDSPSSGVRKKRKVVSSKMTSPSLLEDVMIADGLTSDRSELDLGSPRVPEWISGPQEDTLAAAFTSTIEYGTNGTEVEVGGENFPVFDMDKTLMCDDNYVKDDVSLIKNHSFSSTENVVCVADSGDDELIASDSDVSSCPSSPDDLLLFSDFSFPINPEASPSLSRNGMIYETDKAFNRGAVFADRNIFSPGNHFEKASSDKAQSIVKMPSLLPQGTTSMQKLNLTRGKFTSSKNKLTSSVPNVFPHIPLHLNGSKNLPSAHTTKSRTWHRPGSAPAVPTAPKLQSCPLPQNHAAKMSKVPPSSPVAVIPKLQPCPLPQSGATEISRVGRTWHRPGSDPVATTAPILQSCLLPQSHAAKISKIAPNNQTYNFHKGHSLVRKPTPSKISSPGFNAFSSSVYRRSPSVEGLTKSQASTSKVVGVDAPSVQRIAPVTASGRPEGLPPSHDIGKSSNSGTCNFRKSLPVTNYSGVVSPKTVDTLDETTKSSANHGCLDSGHIAESQSTLNEGNSGKKMVYIKRRSNQLIATSDSEDTSMSAVDKTRASLSDGYYKSKKNQLVRTSAENHATKGDATVCVNSSWHASQTLSPRSSIKLQLRKGVAKTYRSSKSSSVWKLHDVQSSEKRRNAERPQRLLSRLFSFKRASYRRSFVLNLGSKPNNNSSSISHKLLVSRKRGAVYTRSTHGYSLRMSKVLSVGGSSLKWSKSIEKNSKEANEHATRAVAAAEKRKKEANLAVPVVMKSRNYLSRERIFRIGSERYKMDPTRRTLHRITADEKPSPSIGFQSEKNVKRSYVPRRLFIGNDEYVRTRNGNKLVRDPKKRTRVLASEKVRWSLRTARMRLVRKKKYCQFFTKFGKCNKDDGKCPYIHDSSKVVVCTKFLNGSCSNPNCKLTHKVIPERMQDCSYFQKGSCSNENCPYRHVNVDPDSSVCESFLRGYCADGNECRKKHTYVCPAYEATGVCPQACTCKLHHPRKKEKKPEASEEKTVRGRYFDGGSIDVAECSVGTSERAAKGKDEIALREGNYPDFISLDASEDEMEDCLVPEEARDVMSVEIDELSPFVDRGPILYSTLAIDSLCEC